jgi:hypothetical protein
VTRAISILLITLALTATFPPVVAREPPTSAHAAWVASRHDLSKSLTFEIEIQLPIDGAVKDLERYFLRHRFDVETRTFPSAKKGSAIIIAKRHGVFTAQWIDAVATDIARLAPRQTGGHWSFMPDWPSS